MSKKVRRYMPGKPPEDIPAVFAAGASTIALARPALAEQGQPLVTAQGSYVEILRQGMASFQTGFDAAKNRVQLGASVAKALSEASIAYKVDAGLDTLREEMTIALSARPGWGILLEVRRYDNPNGDGYIQGDGPMYVGIGPTPSEAAADFLEAPPLSEPPPKGMILSPKAYMIWAHIGEDGTLHYSDTRPYKDVWRDGDAEYRRRKVGDNSAILHQHLLSVASDFSAYTRMGNIAEQRLKDDDLRNQLKILEERRKNSFDEWAKATKDFEAASKRSASHQWLYQISKALELISVGLKAAEVAERMGKTSIDGATRTEPVDATSARRAAGSVGRAAYSEFQQTVRTVEEKGVIYMESTQTVRAFYIQNGVIDQPSALPNPSRALPQGIYMPSPD